MALFFTMGRSPSWSPHKLSIYTVCTKKRKEMWKSKHWNNSLFCLWKIARAFFFLDVGFIFLHFFLLVIWVCLFYFWKKTTPYHKFLTKTSKTLNSKFKSFVFVTKKNSERKIKWFSNFSCMCLNPNIFFPIWSLIVLIY